MNDKHELEDPRFAFFGRLVGTHTLLAKRLDDEMEKEVGISLLWFGVLLHLSRSPGGFRPISDLVEATALTSGGVTRLVDRIEQAGYVERRPCPNDRRVTFVGLTASGRDILIRASAVHARGIQEHIVDALCPAQLEQMNLTLATLLAALSGKTAHDANSGAEPIEEPVT